MVYEAQFQVLVAQTDTAIQRFLEATEESGGYLQARANHQIVCKVPAARFRDLIAELPKLGRVVSENIRAQDVTKQHFDLSLRLKTLEQALARLTELLARATEIEDVLAIEEQIRRLTSEIEQLRGELQFLDHRVAFSTVTVSFESQAPAPRRVRLRSHSRFPWINEIGLERILERL